MPAKQKTAMSPPLISVFLSLTHSPSPPSLRLSPFSIIPCIEALIKSQSWLPAQHCNDEGGYFRLERACSPLHGEHVISLSLL